MRDGSPTPAHHQGIITRASIAGLLLTMACYFDPSIPPSSLDPALAPEQVTYHETPSVLIQSTAISTTTPDTPIFTPRYPDEPASNNPILLPKPPDRDVYDLAQRFFPEAADSIHQVVSSEPTIHNTNRRDSFNVINLAERSANISKATLRLVSPHAYWYVNDEAHTNNADLEKAAFVFEDHIYPKVTGVFGKEWTPGVDNDPHMTILHTRLSGAAGYYSSNDEYPIQVKGLSNQREMLYISTRLPVASPIYMAVLAHELQHAAHWHADPAEQTWVNEGLAELATEVAGYQSPVDWPFANSPPVSLTEWPDDPKNSHQHYRAAHFFFRYFTQHYGGLENVRLLVEEPLHGIAGVNAYLRRLGYPERFAEIFKEWVVANYLGLEGEGRYAYRTAPPQIEPPHTIRGKGKLSGTLPQFAADYFEILPEAGSSVLIFQGQPSVQLLPTQPRSGNFCWWSNRGDSIDAQLTRRFDLREVSSATLDFWIWYNIEQWWDYAYVAVSTDEGANWQILEGKHTSPLNPVGNSYGPGFTGQSAGWVQERIDLTPFIGNNLLVRFEYVTDEAINLDGLCLDDIAVGEIGFFDDAESMEAMEAWDAKGFVRTKNILPQIYALQLIKATPDGDLVVHDLPLGPSNTARFPFEGPGRATVIVAPMTEITRQEAIYTLELAPVP